jgi:segregation and condensation protein A
VSSFQVALEVFEGPLDLLLTLVRRASLDISNVSLARVTHDYLRYLSELEEIDSGALADFCEVAASLLYLKSLTLLPQPPVSLEDVEEESPEALAERLREYGRYRETAHELAHRFERGLRAYVRVPAPPEFAPRLEPGEVSVDVLAAAFETALAEAQQREPQEEGAPVRPHRYRLSDRLRDIRAVLLARRRVDFHELLIGDRVDREFIIVSFLAVLELLRRAAVRAVQEELFGAIRIEVRPEAAAFWAAQDPFGMDASEGPAYA